MEEQSTPTDDLGEDQDLREILNSQEREQKRLARRPPIDHLPDAVTNVNGRLTFLQGKGMRVIIERFASVLPGRPWLDTRSYIVNSIDEATGELQLWDEENERRTVSNFVTGTQLGYRFKMPQKGPSPIPRKKPEADAEAKQPKAKPVAGEAKETERRIYSTKGVLHTRLKGLAFVPQGSTQAADGMRLLTVPKGTNLQVKHPTSGWTETWVPNKDL